MNLLAHALLSGKCPGVIVGGIIGDWIKGPIEDGLGPAIAEGVKRHRRVDVFTDAHPITHGSRNRLQERWSRYSGILVDMAYDFCLAAHWGRFGQGSLEEFVQQVHGMARDFMGELPGSTADVARRMIAEEWMLAGESWDGVGRTLERVSRRLRHPVPLGEAVADLRRLESALALDF